MKKLAAFIVNKRWFILFTILIIAIAFAACMPFVQFNNDLTKYLPSNSSMRMGLEIMEDTFPEEDTSQSIRVMFSDLDKSEIADIKARLEIIDYVDSITYDTSEKYNKNNYTLFVLNMSYDYGSAEETAIVNTLETDFSDNNFVYRNNDTSIGHIPAWVLILAMIILIVVLLVMCGS